MARAFCERCNRIRKDGHMCGKQFDNFRKQQREADAKNKK
jgi:hypothetical protein